jgi:hypothetical protein
MAVPQPAVKIFQIHHDPRTLRVFRILLHAVMDMQRTSLLLQNDKVASHLTGKVGRLALKICQMTIHPAVQGTRSEPEKSTLSGRRGNGTRNGTVRPTADLREAWRERLDGVVLCHTSPVSERVMAPNSGHSGRYFKADIHATAGVEPFRPSTMCLFKTALSGLLPFA